MDSMPVDVVGLILSRVASARHVARASATCRRWRDAALHHCRKLSFDRSDFPWLLDQIWRMAIITKEVWQRTSLCELVICDTEVEEAHVMAWLLHTKQTLKSLTLLVDCSTFNTLERLACCEVALECLVWQNAYIFPEFDPAIHSLPSLVSLTLQDMAVGLHTVTDLEVLLSLFPNLQFLSLSSSFYLKGSSPMEELHIPPSLKALHLEDIFWSHNLHFVLHADNLIRLSLVRVGSYLMTIFGHCLESLDIQDLGDLEQLDFGDLPSLLDLKLDLPEDLATEVLQKASSKLRNLSIPRCQPFDLIGDMIASLFPCLRQLSLNFWYAALIISSSKLIMFKHVVALKLYMDATDTAELDPHIIVMFLKHFPNLKQLTLARFSNTSSLSNRFTPHLKQSYPRIDIRVDPCN